jgi:hypothetical protein
MPENPANAASEGRGRAILQRLELLRRFPLTLVLCAILSVIFVVGVAALIAFMQYQARLLRSQPGITASQLVYYVDTEENIEQEVNELGRLSKEISKATPVFTYTNNEINYRIDRICGLFDTGPDAAAQIDKCRRFLNQIPFQSAGGTAATPPVLAPDASALAKLPNSASPQVEPISADLLKNIVANFVEVMGTRKLGGADSSKLVPLFEADLGTIARLNQNYWLQIRPHYLYQLQKYAATCQHLNQLIAIVSTYRTIDSGCSPEMPNVDASAGPSAAASAKTPDSTSKPAIATGGDIIPGTGTGQPTAGAAATGNAPTPTPQDTASPPPGPGGATARPDTPASNPPPVESPKPEVSKGGPILPSAQPALSAIDRARAFELVTHYRFYDRISLRKLRDILISPSDFLALVLVGVAGILGSLLRIVFSSYISGKDPTPRSVLISPILGLICALVIYNLFRSGFIVLTDQPQASDSVPLSPFVIALLAMAAGLLSERTIEFFRKTSDNWLGTVEASQAARWAVNLQRELDTHATTAEKLAERLDVSAAKIKDWAEEKEPVPIDKQRDIAFALNVPVRRIFTDIEPAKLV